MAEELLKNRSLNIYCQTNSARLRSVWTGLSAPGFDGLKVAIGRLFGLDGY